jgi:hypothetical protein
MDSSHESIDGPARPAAPYVVVFFRHGDELSARIRDVQSQEQWILPDARPLRELLTRPLPPPEPSG